MTDLGKLLHINWTNRQASKFCRCCSQNFRRHFETAFDVSWQEPSSSSNRSRHALHFSQVGWRFEIICSDLLTGSTALTASRTIGHWWWANSDGCYTWKRTRNFCQVVMMVRWCELRHVVTALSIMLDDSRPAFELPLRNPPTFCMVPNGQVVRDVV